MPRPSAPAMMSRNAVAPRINQTRARPGDKLMYSGRAVLCRDHVLGLLAQAFDAEMHGLAGLQEHGLRLGAHAHARRRAGGDHVASMQRDEMADVRDNLLNGEDHGLRVAVLLALAVPLKPQLQVL